VYYLPVIITFAAHACVSIFRRPGVVVAAASLLVAGELLVAVPAAREAVAFRAAPAEAVQTIVRQPGGTKVVVSDNPVALHHLEYLGRTHPGFRVGTLDTMLDSFNRAHAHYLLTGIGYAADARPVGRWRTSGRFFAFAGRLELADLWLYEIDRDPPPRLVFDAGRRFTPFAPAVSSDRWVGAGARCLLGVRPGATTIRVVGAEPRLRGRTARYRVAVRAAGVDTGGFEIRQPGAFIVTIPLPPGPRVDPTMVVDLIPEATWIPAELDPQSPDHRRLSFQLASIEII
jgi:hypothetical protein